LEQLLRQKENWTTKDIKDLIFKKFSIMYTLKKIYIIPRDMAMNFAKPYPHDYRRPADAEEMLKKLPKMDQKTVIGFLDEASPQTTANTQRLWSYDKLIIYKNTTNIRANTFGFYALNGNSTIDFEPDSKKESVCDFLKAVWKANIEKNTIMILDNFQSHKAKIVRQYVEDHRIKLVFLPPYSADLNPIEFIWKSIKGEISYEFIRDANHVKGLILENLYRFSERRSVAANWIKVFLGDKLSILS